MSDAAPAVCGKAVTLLADIVGGRPEVVCDLPPDHAERDGLLHHQSLPTGQRFSWPVRIET